MATTAKSAKPAVISSQREGDGISEEVAEVGGGRGDVLNAERAAIAEDARPIGRRAFGASVVGRDADVRAVFHVPLLLRPAFLPTTEGPTGGRTRPTRLAF
jgi:hypothetical protein